MDEKELKQEELSETESSTGIEYYWPLFNVDLSDIICKDLQPLFAPQCENDTDDNITFNEKEILAISAKTKGINENGKILISKIYGKTFILYPQHNTLISFDSITMTDYINDKYQNNSSGKSIPERGICPPHKLYRVFNKIRANKMRLSFNEEYIALSHYSSFNVYHIAQFFNETEPKPIWQIIPKEHENIFEFDWNDNALFLVMEKKNEETGVYERILKHYTLSDTFTSPIFIGMISNIPHNTIMEIKLLMNGIFAVCLRNGFVIFYRYNNEKDSYVVVYTINITKQHKEECKSRAVPYLITWMEQCKEICIHYGVQNEGNDDDNKYTPYFCIFRYAGSDPKTCLKSMKRISSDHTGLNDITFKDMSICSHEGIKSMYIAHVDLLIFCCKYDYKLAIYGPNRDVLDNREMIVKYDEDSGIAHICDIALDVNNEIQCQDLETEQYTLPPVPILTLLSNKLNFGCFNIIPYDPDYNDKVSLPIMQKPIRALPPIPMIQAVMNKAMKSPPMTEDILEKYRKLYHKYFTDLYIKYAPDKVGNIETLMAKYSSSYGQLQGLYDRLLKKYTVRSDDIQPLISIQEIEQMNFDNANQSETKPHIDREPEAAPDTPIKTNLMSSFNATSSGFDTPSALQTTTTQQIQSTQSHNNESNEQLEQHIPDHLEIQHKEDLDASGFSAPSLGVGPSFGGLNDLESALQFINDDNVSGISALASVVEAELKNDEHKSPVRIRSKEVMKKKAKAPFSSAIFDENVPNHEVEYEFFNALKHIQVQMERLQTESDEFESSMKQTTFVLESTANDTKSIDECTQDLHNLSTNLKQHKQNRNNLESQLVERSLKKHRHTMYLDAMKLKTKAQKFADPEYRKALKMRGLDEEQENILIGISDKITEAQTKTESWRDYRNDEREQQRKQTPNELYKSCIMVENLVTERYNKYMELVSEHAPHLLLQNLSIVPRTNKPLSSSPIIPHKSNDVLYLKHMNLQKISKYNPPIHRTPRNKWNKLSKYEKRLSDATKFKPISRYNYKQYITPRTSISSTNQTTRTQSPFKSPQRTRFNLSQRIPSPQKSPHRDRLSLRKERQERRNTMDLKKFQTKVQRTPCKSSKKPAALKKLMTEKTLSRQQSGLSMSQISQQKPSDLQFQRTPGFETIKRRDRRRAARFETTEPYKPPKKPSNFVEFSPKKDKTTAETKVESPQRVTVSSLSQNVNTNVTESRSRNKPQLELQSTEPITPTSNASNTIIGLTRTPPLLPSFPEQKLEEKEEKSPPKSRWGFGDSTQQKPSENTPAIANPFGSFESQPQQQPMDALSIYKQRITTIYTNVGQSQKLPKVLARLNGKDINWMHSLYCKICAKYKINPEGIVQSQANTSNNQQNSGMSGLGSWGNTGNTGFGGNAGNTGNTGNTGFGSMNNWNAGNNDNNENNNNNNNNNQQQNTFSNLGSGGGNAGNTSWNWGGSQNTGNANVNNNNNNNNNLGFASSSSNQPLWVANANLSMNSNNGGNTQSDPFAAFASGGGGFGSLLS